MKCCHRLALTAAVALVAVVGATAAFAAPAALQGTTLTVYSGRAEAFAKPLFDLFTKDTGIEVEARYADSATLAATILEEGSNSPADLFWGQEAGAVGAVSREGLLAVLPAEALARVPPRFRSPNRTWVGTSGRARVLAYNTEAVQTSELPKSSFALTASRWKGKVGLPPTNASFQAFVSQMRVVYGDDRTRDWLLALKANDVKFFSSSSQVLAALARGEIEVGLVNHYYLTALKAQQPTAPVANHFFAKGDPGAMVNCAAVGILKTSQHAAAAQKLVAFLLSKRAQHHIARGPGNAEYPLVQGVLPRPGLPKLGDVKGPDLNLGRLGRELPLTLRLLSEVGFTR
ncbi:MAG: iron ABC transporter substrate-binding protein [Thermoleophilia bacterium]|nr:iron ABC transporter substrate-binding protein [Thermoleophilia bacterium]